LTTFVTKFHKKVKTDTDM